VNLIGPNTSDPYAVLELAGTKHTSSIIKKTCNPQWNSETEFFQFLVYHERQSLKMTLYDHDLLKKDDLLGALPADLDRTVLGLLEQQSKQGYFGVRLPLDTEGTVQIGLKYVAFSLKGVQQASSGPSVVSVKLYHMHGLKPELATGAKIRATIGNYQEVSKKSKRIHPKEFHGFGKKQSEQMKDLYQSGSSVEDLGSAFRLDPEIVQETVDHMNKNEKGIMRFGWDESLHMLVNPVSTDNDSIKLEICIKDLMTRTQAASAERFGEPRPVLNFQEAPDAAVGITLVRSQGALLEDMAAIAKFAVGRNGGLWTTAGHEQFIKIRESRSATTKLDFDNADSRRSKESEPGSYLGFGIVDDDDGSSTESYGMRAISSEIMKSGAEFWEWSDNFDG